MSIITPNIYIYIYKEELFSFLSNLQTDLFRTYLPKLDWHTRDEWLIPSTKHHKDNLSQILKHPAEKNQFQNASEASLVDIG